jgi:hypothetical protein
MARIASLVSNPWSWLDDPPIPSTAKTKRQTAVFLLFFVFLGKGMNPAFIESQTVHGYWGYQFYKEDTRQFSP